MGGGGVACELLILTKFLVSTKLKKTQCFGIGNGTVLSIPVDI